MDLDLRIWGRRKVFMAGSYGFLGSSMLKYEISTSKGESVLGTASPKGPRTQTIRL